MARMPYCKRRKHLSQSEFAAAIELEIADWTTGELRALIEKLNIALYRKLLNIKD